MNYTFTEELHALRNTKVRDKQTKAVVFPPPLIMKVHLQLQHHDKVFLITLTLY